MKLEIVDSIGARHAVSVAFEATETVSQLVDRIGREADIEGGALLQMALESDGDLDDTARAVSLPIKRARVEVHRVCVSVHVEGESDRQNFPATAHWRQVHRWACRRFTIASDSCANMELHMGKIDGPVLNERKQIGQHEGCVEVWLVKPGAEPNGSCHAGRSR